MASEEAALAPLSSPTSAVTENQRFTTPPRHGGSAASAAAAAAGSGSPSHGGIPRRMGWQRTLADIGMPKDSPEKVTAAFGGLSPFIKEPRAVLFDKHSQAGQRMSSSGAQQASSARLRRRRRPSQSSPKPRSA